MKHPFFYFSLAIAFTIVSCAKRQPDVRSDERTSITPRLGQYVSEHYRTILLETRNPQIAGADSIPPFAEVRRDSTIEFHNTHEGYDRFRIGADGTLQKHLDEYPDSSRCTVETPTTLVYESAHGQKVRYNLIDSAETGLSYKSYVRWVSITLLKGTYMDALNKTYTFTDSLFILPSGKYRRYGVAVDCFGGPPECPCISLDTIPYHFTFSSDTLKIFETYGEDNAEIRSQPKWVLLRKQ